MKTTFDYKQPVSSLRWFDNPGVHQADWSEVLQRASAAGEVAAYGIEECETCDATFLIENYGGGCSHRDMDGTDCDGYISTFEGPMMNAWHACGSIRDEQEAARALTGLPLCLVNVDGQYGIAMTGGGMDMSWYLVEGFCRLGFVPPAYFRLPIMGERYGARERFLTGALKRSILGEINSMRNAMRDLKATVADCKRNEDKRAQKKAS